MRLFKSTILCLIFIIASVVNIDTHAAAEIGANVPQIILAGGSSFDIHSIDAEREREKLTIYTVKFGEYTAPFDGDTHEYIVVNNIVVQKSNSGSTGTYIPPNGYVISYTGSNAALAESLAAGMEIKLSNIDIPILPDMYFKLGDMLVPIDRVNSLREANQITLYDYSYGISTKTNAWGMELTIVDGTISKVTDIAKEKGVMLNNDSPIPADGVVISIHSGSTYYKQLHENARPGDKVLVSADNKLYNASKIKYAAFNPRTISDNPEAWDKGRGKPYDGFRGPNQLIVYDSSYSSRTGTNPYGYEIAVDGEGTVVSAGGNDSEIPEGGFILSGHGDKVKWLQKYAQLGAEVSFNTQNKELLVIFSPDSYINLASISIKEASDSLELARLQYRDVPYDRVESCINGARTKLSDIRAQAAEGKYNALTDTVKEIQIASDTAYFMAFESVKIENRAVWLRPRDTAILQIQKRLDALKALNINTIFLETYWNGYAIYPTGSDIVQQNPMFNGMDILEIYLKEAHARGIEVHAWVENFLVDQPVAVKKPDWMAISRKGDSYYLENGSTKYYFLNPALPEVRSFLSGLYQELVRKYNLDGIQFDYMRYSHSGDYSNDFGYDTYTRQLFAAYSGTDPITLKPGTAQWDKWCDFRAHTISSYAYRIFSEVKSIKPGIRISSDVWPEYDKTLVDIYQDPKAWTSKDYINSLIPMSYYLDEASVVDDIMNTQPFVRGHSLLTPGIATFNKVDTKVLLRQVNAIRDSEANGIAIFEFESLFSGRYSEALKLGAFSTPSVVAGRNPEQSINIILEDIIRKIDTIYLKYKGIDVEQAENLKRQIVGINVSLKEAENSAQAAYNLKHEIEELRRETITDSKLNEEIAERISSDLNIAINIIDAYIAGTRFMNNHQVREFQAEMPLGALKSTKAAPVRIKAVFNDSSSMYLHSSQYLLRSDNPASAEIIGDTLKLTGSTSEASITVDILDTFRFDTVKGLTRKIGFSVSQDGMTPGPVLKASEAGYTDVRLHWGNTVVASEITGYVLYRNNIEIARLSSDTFHDRSLQPAGTYTYEVHGFDASGNILYKSSPVTVKTKASILLSSK